jgi:Protein of unknown function (DUF3631)
MMVARYDAHVTAWAKHHARQSSRTALADGYEPQALHEYTDADGNPTHWRIRLKHPISGDKWIRPMMRVGTEFALKQPEYLNGTPLYRLHELVTHQHQPVFIVEGELCADALAAIGIVATTSGGAESVGKADWSIFTGGNFSVWPDNDDAGQRYAQAVKDILESNGCTVAIIDVTKLDLPVKGDCVNWLAANPNATADKIHLLPKIYVNESRDGISNEAAIINISVNRTDENDEAVIARLAAMPALEYDRCRKEQAKAMGVRPATLDHMVKAQRADEDAPETPFTEPEPWHESIDPVALLSELSATIRRFIVLEPKQADAAALWIAFTWFTDVVEVAPLAIINAPEKACGKSQLLTLFGRLVARPLPAANSTAAFLFRAVELWEPTVLIDEADTFIRDNDELKGLVNAGHTRQNAYVGRVVGENHEPKLFKVWGAKAMAGIALEKHLPDSTMSRAVVFNMRRKLPGETVERLRYADTAQFEILASKLVRFADDYRETLRIARPSLPDALGDRAQDNWEPLLAIANCAGENWVQRATTAALELSGIAEASQSPGNELLADIQRVFETKKVERISMADLVAALIEDDEAPWLTWNRGKPLSTRQLGRMLSAYGIQSKTVRVGYGNPPKGYELSYFEDAFARYLSRRLEKGVFGVTQSHPNENKVLGETDATVTHQESHKPVTPKPAWIKDCDYVTEKITDLADAEAKYPNPSRLRI